MKQKRCPSKEEFIRFFEGGGAERREQELLSHVLSCPECLTVFEATREIRSQGEEILWGLEGLDLRSRETRKRLQKSARREIARLRESRRRKKGAFLRWVGIPAIGAALVLLTLFAIIPSVTTSGHGDLERNGSPMEIELLQPRGAVPLSTLSFKWTPRPSVQSYHLEIYDRSLEPVYQAGPLGGDCYLIPDGALALIRKNEVYYWKIVATLQDNQQVESDFAKFVAH
jgi:hypothetical protein